MPAKRGKKTATAKSQEDTIQLTFRKFSAHLEKAKKTSGTIGVPPTLLKAINGIITAYRTNHTLINEPEVDSFAQMLDHDGRDANLCSRFKAETFSIALRVILQMEACKEAERGLYLLAASLFRDAQDMENGDDLDKKKDMIGTQCLVELLSYFVDAENDFGMRRWVGLLCVQLVTDCESNHSKLEQAPEESRRGIGRQVIEENDEILKVIYAKLLRAMVENETPLGDMYPENYDEELYYAFPSSSQGSAGWLVQFQKYVDDLPDNMSNKATDDHTELFFATKIQLTPGDQLGPRHHNAVLFVDGVQLSFLATSREGHFDTILDVPILLIKKITFVLDNTSQIDSLRITLEIGEHDQVDDDLRCFLDAKALQLNMVAFSMVSKSRDNFQNIILQFRDDIEISYSDTADHGSMDYTQTTTKVTSMDLGESQARSQESRSKIQELDSSNELSRDQRPRRQIQELGNSNELSQNQPSRSQEDNNNSTKSLYDPEDQQDSNGEQIEGLGAEENLYSASPRMIQNKKASPNVAPPSSMPQPAIPRGRKGVKPKAKAPIVIGRHSLDTKLMIAKSTSRLANTKPATDSNAKAKGNSLTRAKARISPGVQNLTVAVSGMRTEKKATTTKLPPQTQPTTKHPIMTSVAVNAHQPAAAKKTPKRSAAGSKPVTAIKTADPDHEFPDEMSSPDANDAYTPEALNTQSVANPATTVTSSVRSQFKPNIVDAHDSPSPPRKRYGLHQPTRSALQDADGKSVIVKGKAVEMSANPISQPETKATKLRGTSKADKSKRQSAPAALQATRQSQRAAASKARDLMQVADDGDDDDYEVKRPGPIKQKLRAIGKKTKTSTNQTPTEPPKESTADPQSYSQGSDQSIGKLQAEDARSLGLARDGSPLSEQNQGLHNASPRVSHKDTDLAHNLPEEVNSSPKPASKNSGMDLATKLGKSLGCLDSEPEQDELQLPVPIKYPGANVKPRHEKSEQQQEASEDVEAIQVAGNQGVMSEHQGIEEMLHQNPSPSEYDSVPLPLILDTSAAPSPPPLLPDNPDASLPETDGAPDEGSPEVPSPPVMQETIETQMEAQISTEVVHTANTVQMSDTVSAILNTGLGLVVGDQITLSEEVRAVKAVALSKKRKPTPEKSTAIKRRRAEEDVQGVNEQDLGSVLPVKAGAINATRKKPRKSNENPNTPMRRSPRLATKVTPWSAEAEKDGPKTSTIVKDPNRKPQVINFGGQGPRNQGIISTSKSEKRSAPPEARGEVSTAELHAADRKRKREKSSLAEDASPPKKKQNSSPLAELNDYCITEPNSSPPLRIAKANQGRHRFASRPSSQTSRVDRNGSPIADESPIDHFRKLKERLAEPGIHSMPRVANESLEAQTTLLGEVINRPRRASQVFGPKISLGQKLKARPASPNEPNSRYVAHGESHGVYTEVETKQVIKEKKILPDPFIERNRKSSGFIERLQNSASKGNSRAKNGSESRHQSRDTPIAREHRIDVIRPNDKQELPEHLRQKRILHRGSQRFGLMKQIERRTRSHVYEQSSPSDLTSGTSYESQSSDTAKTPLQELSTENETWNLAVRPHYNTFGQAVHRIADELIIRLSSEEEKMNLLVDQYRENGTKLLDSLQKKREIQRGIVSRNLDQKKSEMAAVFAESKSTIMETAESIRKQPTSHFEKDWRRKQNAIRKQISGVRKVMDE